MYTELANRLSVKSSAAEVSQPVSMEGANAALLDFTIYEGTVSETLTVKLQGSNDLQNWEDLVPNGSSKTGDIPGYYVASQGAYPVPYAYVRLHYSTAGTKILNAGVNVYEQ